MRGNEDIYFCGSDLRQTSEHVSPRLPKEISAKTPPPLHNSTSASGLTPAVEWSLIICF